MGIIIDQYESIWASPEVLVYVRFYLVLSDKPEFIELFLSHKSPTNADLSK